MSDNENTADIVTRLRDWRSLHLTRLGGLFDEAAAEIERLRSRPCPYVTGDVTQHCTLTPFTLTPEEREAIAWAVSAAEDCQHPADDALRGLLERMSPARRNGEA